MIGFYLFRALEFMIMLLPRFMRKALFIGLSKLAYFLDKKHRLIARQNLNVAFGNILHEHEIVSIIRYAYKNLLLALLQVIENRRLTKAELGRKVTFVNRELVESIIKEKKPIVFISAHVSNWELGASALASQIIPLNAVHKAMNNHYFDHYLHQSRSRFNLNMIEKHGATRHLSKALKNGGAVSLLIDQNVNPKDGIIVDFFSKSVTQTPAPAFLARKYNAPIIPLAMTTEDEEHYTITFSKPIIVAQTDNIQADILEATQAQSKWLEDEIKQNPKFWFWMHRRWKTMHPEIYAKKN